jgi:hypothetical protein
VYRYFPEDIAYSILFTEAISIKYINSIEAVLVVFQKINILRFEALLLKIPNFGSYNVAAYWLCKHVVSAVTNTYATM